MQTKDIMGMPITVNAKDGGAAEEQKVLDYFRGVDETFSTYKQGSEISKINRGELAKDKWSAEVKEIFRLAEQTKQETDGYFDIKNPGGSVDPSGLVKGWAIWQAGLLLKQLGCQNFLIEAGGDVQASLPDTAIAPWRVGIRNPFNSGEIIKILNITNQGVATSGVYERGQHIYNPHKPGVPISDIASLTVVGPNIYEADRFATAAFAMGKDGIDFIEKLDGLEGYIINNSGIATMTSGFAQYIAK